MKTLLYIPIVFLLLSCQKEELINFQPQKASVYFYLNPDVKRNEISATFITSLEDQLTVHIPVRCSGLATTENRSFKLAVDTASTAIGNRDFEPLADSYTLQANSYETLVPVTLLRTKLLQDSTLSLQLNLQESEDFSIGEKLRQKAVIRFSDQLTKPENWDEDFYMSYSRVKHQVFLIVTGRASFPTTEEWEKNSYYYKLVVPRVLSAYFREHYPVKDENGNIIEPW